MQIKIYKDLVKGKLLYSAQLSMFEKDTPNITKVKVESDTIPKLLNKLQDELIKYFNET